MGFFGSPLFSTVITFCTLILLYFPNHFLLLVFSPILISTSFLLLSLLRLGAIQRSTQPPTSTTVKESNINAVVPTTEHDGLMILDEYHEPVLSESNEEFSTNLDFNNSTQQLSITHHDLFIDDHAWVCSDLSAISSKCDSVSAGPTKSFYSDSFVEWDLRAPLEIIYEEYEGEEEEDDEEGKREVQMAIIERYASLSKFYPETDSDISSEEDILTIRDWDSPEHVCFQWEGDDKEGMIEIELGRTKKYSEDEEENLIEIDLYPASYPTVKKIMDPPAPKNKKENDHFPMMIRYS